VVEADERTAEAQECLVDIAPPPGELFSETNDNWVTILLPYGTARVLLVGDAETRVTWRAVHARGLKRSSTFRNYTHTEPGFRALLTESGNQRVELARA
jgi:beta-lactamase superfamily II metal-dependent hydrolase